MSSRGERTFVNRVRHDIEESWVGGGETGFEGVGAAVEDFVYGVDDVIYERLEVVVRPNSFSKNNYRVKRYARLEIMTSRVFGGEIFPNPNYTPHPQGSFYVQSGARKSAR